MAAIEREEENSEVKTGLKLLKPDVFNLHFDDELNSNICGELVVGIIKYLLYQRGQIPEMFEGLVSRSNETLPSQVTNVRNIRTNIQAKKIKFFVDTFQELFVNLRTVFLRYEVTRVSRVALVFGSTPVNPKELHCVEIPSFVVPKDGDGGMSSYRLARKHLMVSIRNLVASARHVNFADLQVTNVTVLLEMSRDSRIGWFLPKPNYSDLPRRGRHFRYVLSWKPDTETHTLTSESNEYTVKSKPFTVHESPANEPRGTDPQREIEVRNENDERTNDDNNEGERCHDSEGSEDELIWFQMPVVTKGLSVNS